MIIGQPVDHRYILSRPRDVFWLGVKTERPTRQKNVKGKFIKALIEH